MKKIRVAGTGLDGLVGSRIVELLKKDIDFIPLSQTIMDITDVANIRSMIQSIDFDLFLHMAAYTQVDGAEKEKDTAWKVNVEGTRNVWKTVTAKNKPFIYISTDFVFDGMNTPFFEDSMPHPISYYGLTKYEGEKILKGSTMIVRLSYPYRSYFENKTDIVRSIILALKDKKPIKGIMDQILTFTFIDDIACALRHLFFHYSSDIFHIVGVGSMSGYEAIQTIGRIFQLDTSHVEKITYDEFYKNKAHRPKKGIIKSKKNTFYKMSSFEEGLKEIKKQLYQI
ncbi:MAG TPA: sugar nucleotide-binding protein [Patescibacteria group bacterium]|nr:sugar nucleotide-binding protein [Patescibacteria group bacterium]